MSKSNPKVTIGIPVYGVEKYVERCVRSLFSQTYIDVEYLFVDDCSTDDSVNIIKGLIEEYGIPNARVLRHEVNCGLVEARNTVIANAQGKYLMWVDADDWVENSFVKDAIETIESTDYDVVCFGYKIHYIEGEVDVNYPVFSTAREYLDSILLSNSPYEVWNKIAKTSIYQENNIHSEPGCNVAEDFVMSSKLLFFSKKTCTLQKLLYHYNKQNPNSYSSVNEEYRYHSYWKSYESLERFFADYPSFLQKLQTTGAYQIVADLVEYSKCTQKKYYYQSKNRIILLPRRAIEKMSLPRRLVIFLSGVKVFMVPYCRLAHYVRRKDWM